MRSPVQHGPREHLPLCLLALMTFLPACAPSPAPLAPTSVTSPTQAPTLTATPTTAPSPTRAAAPDEPPTTSPPSPTASLTPATPTEALAPAFPLPWVLVCSLEGETLLIDPIAGQRQDLEIPRCPDPWGVTSAGNMIAYVARGTEGHLTELHVLHAPDLAEVAAFSLAPGELSTSYGHDALAWSPDGRYLATTTEGTEQGSSLLLLDVVDGEMVPVWDGPQPPMVFGWSPDRRWLVFLTGPGTFEAAWAASADGGQPRRLYETFMGTDTYFVESLEAWTGGAAFVTFGGPGEGCYYWLREVDVAGARSRMVYESNFVDAAVDPSSRVAFLIIPEEGMCAYSAEPGLYRLPLGGGSLQLVSAGSALREVEWFGELGRFAVRNYPPPGISLFFPRGSLDLSLEEAEEIYPSPDGNWILARMATTEVQLLDSSGETVSRVETAPPQQVLWLPDSQALIALVDGELVRVDLDGRVRALAPGLGTGKIIALLWPPR